MERLFNWFESVKQTFIDIMGDSAFITIIWDIPLDDIYPDLPSNNASFKNGIYFSKKKKHWYAFKNNRLWDAYAAGFQPDKTNGFCQCWAAAHYKGISVGAVNALYMFQPAATFLRNNNKMCAYLLKRLQDEYVVNNIGNVLKNYKMKLSELKKCIELLQFHEAYYNWLTK